MFAGRNAVTTARLSFQQRSYAKCQICNETMYSWNSRNVPIFTLMNASNGETPDIQPYRGKESATNLRVK
jgi:hypothetical protein